METKLAVHHGRLLPVKHPWCARNVRCQGTAMAKLGKWKWKFRRWKCCCWREWGGGTPLRLLMETKRLPPHCNCQLGQDLGRGNIVTFVWLPLPSYNKYRPVFSFRKGPHKEWENFWPQMAKMGANERMDGSDAWKGGRMTPKAER